MTYAYEHFTTCPHAVFRPRLRLLQHVLGMTLSAARRKFVLLHAFLVLAGTVCTRSNIVIVGLCL